MRLRRRRSGMGLAETLVSVGLALMISLILAKTFSNMLRAKRIQDEVSRQLTVQRTLDAQLRRLFATGEVQGVTVSPDGQTIVAQPLTRVSTEGQRQWAGEAYVIQYLPGAKPDESGIVAVKSVPFSEAGLTSSSSAPVKLSESDFATLISKEGEGLAHYDKITSARFRLDKDRAFVTARLEREVHNSRAHEKELLLDAAYELRSSTELRKRRPMLGGS